MSNCFTSESNEIPASAINAVFHGNESSTNPRASAEAGGCSVFSTTIRNMEKPTAIAPEISIEFWERKRSEDPSNSNETRWQAKAATIPVRYPPTKKRGAERGRWGSEKAIKPLAPKEATITASLKRSKNVRMSMKEPTINKDWPKYRKGFSRNFWSNHFTQAHPQVH